MVLAPKPVPSTSEISQTFTSDSKLYPSRCNYTRKQSVTPGYYRTEVLTEEKWNVVHYGRVPVSYYWRKPWYLKVYLLN